MSRHPITIPASLTVAQVRERYFGGGQQYRAYPVVERGRVLGMMDRAALAAIAAGASEQSIAQLLPKVGE